MADYLINPPFFLTISLDLTKKSEVRIAGDRSICNKYEDRNNKHAPEMLPHGHFRKHIYVHTYQVPTPTSCFKLETVLNCPGWQVIKKLIPFQKKN